MKFKDQSKSEKSIRKIRYARKPSDALAFLFDKSFDTLNDHPSFLRGNPLELRSTEPFYLEFDARRRSADLFLFPFHTFTDERTLFAEIENRAAGDLISTLFYTAYFNPGAGGEAFYETELLVVKKKIYEQGSDLTDLLIIEAEKDLKPFADKYAIADFADIFTLNISATATAYFTLRKEDGKTTKNDVSFNRFGEIVSFDRIDGGGQRTRVFRLRLADFWLRWSEVATRAGFDFDYLATLEPLEMRFYELTRLLRFKDEQKPLKKQKREPLEITYGDFCRLMPLEKKRTWRAAEDQLSRLCLPHLESDYLKNFEIRRNAGTSLAKSIVEFSFKD